MGLLKRPAGAFSLRSCSGVSAVRRSAPCAPAPRRQRHPPLRPSLRLLRAPSSRKGRDERASRALALRSALRALPLLRLPARGSSCSAPCFAAVLALLHTPLRSTHAVPPVVAFFAAPLLVGGALGSAPFRGSPPRLGRYTPPRRMKGRAECALRVYHPPAPPIKAGSASVRGIEAQSQETTKSKPFFGRNAKEFLAKTPLKRVLSYHSQNNCRRRIVQFFSKCRVEALSRD